MNNIYIFEPIYDYSGGCILFAAKNKKAAIKEFNNSYSANKDFEIVGSLSRVKTKRKGTIYEGYYIE
jgi:hypothetical protein